MRFSRRSTSSAPVIDAANGPNLLPFLAKRIVAPLRGDFREGLQVDGAVLHVAVAREPRLLGGEAEHAARAKRSGCAKSVFSTESAARRFTLEWASQ